jgi:hypothetical protein
MKQDPEYLRNQSRYLHRLHRRNRQFLRFFMILWFAVATILTGAAALDVVAHLGWRYTTNEVWIGVGAAAFGACFWLFARAIMSMNLSIARRLYGPEPTDPRS